VLACLPRRRSRVQIPSRALSTRAARYANRQSGQAQTLVPCGFDSRLRHLRTCVGWASASPTACKAASPQGYAGSTPARRTFDSAQSVYRHRIPDPRSGEAGSIPARATEHDQVAQLADARRSEHRALAALGVRLSLWSLTHCRRGRCPAGSHKAGAPGSIPGPATCGWA
jgi:hypothetical protein